MQEAFPGPNPSDLSFAPGIFPDTFFVGQIGGLNQLAALSITFPIFTLLTAVANLFGIGANSVIARSLGRNDQDTAKKASSFGFWASFCVTAVLALILGTCMKPILGFFKADDFTFSHSARYLLWVFVIGGILNILLDPIFIFEKGETLLGGAFIRCAAFPSRFCGFFPSCSLPSFI